MTAFAQFRRRGYARTLIGTLFVLAYLFPVYWMVATSLKTSGGIFASPPQLVPVPLVFSAYIDAVIENIQWHGYRLNPDRVRLVAPSELPH